MLLRVLSLVAMASAVVIDHTGYPRYCAKDMTMFAMQPLSDPQFASLELVQVQLLVRHGARTPYSWAKCWPSYNEEWNCSLRDQVNPELHTPQGVPSNMTFDKIYSGRNVFKGTCLLGQLIDEGYTQQQQNGALFRKVYVGHGPHALFQVNESLDLTNTNDVFFESTDIPRTVDSGYIIVQNMFPNASAHAVPWHTGDIGTSVLVPSPDLCPAMRWRSGQWAASDQFQAWIQNDTNKALDAQMAAFVPGYNYGLLFDCLMTQRCTDRALPPNITDKFFLNITSKIETSALLPYFYNGNIYARTAASRLVAQIRSRFIDAMDRQGPRFYLSIVHDSTLMPLLAALGGSNYLTEWVPYASHVSLEVYYQNSTNSTYFRLLYQGQPLPVDGCTSELCPADAFLNMTEFSTNTSICSVPPARSSNKGQSSPTVFSTTTLTLGIIAAAVVGGAVGYAISYRIAQNRIAYSLVFGVNTAYPRRIMYQDLSSVEAAIDGLRNLDVESMTYMITPYCWVDFERRWALAHTPKRQERCQQMYVSNGASYLETVLRNIDFNAWVATTQGLFHSRIGAGIEEFSDGASFLSYLEHHEFLLVNDEADFWRMHNIDTFLLQYSNEYQIGILETINIRNILGITWALPIKTIASRNRGTLWTTEYMYGGLQNDLNIPTGNQSIVQNSSTFFGLTNPNLMEETNVCQPLTPVFQAMHNNIGPLANIDLRWISVPVDVINSVQVFRSLILSSIQSNQKFAAAFSTIDTYELQLTPPVWLNRSLIFYGGNPLCGFGAGLDFVQQSFGFDDACATQKALTIKTKPFSSLYAYLMSKGELAEVCKFVVKKSLCHEVISTLTQTKATNPSLDKVTMPASVESLGLSFMQFVDKNGAITIESQLLLDGVFGFFGWISIYEWALNEREAILVQGDVGYLKLLSYATEPQQLVAYEFLSSSAIYLWYFCVLISTSLLVIATLLIVLWIYYRPQKCSWFIFNRIVSASWLNRTFLLLRGFGSIWCLSSGTLIPYKDGNGLHFVNSPRSVFVSLLFAGEVAWITYVLHEVLYPITKKITPIYAPISSHLSIILVFIIDVWSPVQATIDLNRSCFSKNMDQMIYCTSGTAIIGSTQRSILLFSIVLGSITLCFALTRLLPKPQEAQDSQLNEPVQCLLLTSAAIAFEASQTVNSSESVVDVITAAMAGLIGLTINGTKIIFDTKLWVGFLDFKIDNTKIVLSHALLGTNVFNSFGGPEEDCLIVTRLKRHAAQFLFLCGMVHTMVSLVLNVVYFDVARNFLVNDFGWAGFNSTGTHAFLANKLNAQLLISTNQSIYLTGNSFIDANQLYNGTVSPITWSFNAARRELFSAKTSLTSAIEGLRNMDACMLPWMFTQYCFVDFRQTWSMIASPKRLLRCQKQSHNGAIYLEAPLRNVGDWDIWSTCWGSSFEVGFENYLKTSTQGRAWLSNTQNNANSIEDEIVYWRQNNISQFILQWQNYKTLGMTDTLTIKSALGYSSLLTISSSVGNYHILQQTSFRMYWTFASDLWAVSTNNTLIGGKSLIQSSPNFAFINHSNEVLLLENLTLIRPLNTGLDVLQSAIGPFGTIDMHYVLPPNGLLKLYSAVLESVQGLLLTNTQSQIEYFSIPSKTRGCAVPPYLLSDLSIMVNGGNIMCGNDVPFEPAIFGLLSAFGPANACHAEFLEVFLPSTLELLFAFLALQNFTLDFNALCSLDMCAGSSCALDFATTVQFLLSYKESFGQISKLVYTAQQQVLDLNITVIQYYTTLNNTVDTQLYKNEIIDTEDKLWSFYGWCLIYEWTSGIREVVNFSGDRGSISTMTFHQSPITMNPNPTEIPVSFASLFLGCTFYITWILICIAGIVAAYTLVNRGQIEAMNLFQLNRIVGHTWAGRTFLILRSITAIWILNSSTLNLTLVDRVTHFTSPPLPWYKKILAASETTWLVYALNDIFSFITLHHTTYYASKSSLSTWFVVAIWSFVHPLENSSKIQRNCDYVDMDFGLTCTSAIIEIGSTQGVLIVLCIAMGNVIFWYTFERICYPNRAIFRVPTHLLNSQSLYMLDWSKWRVDGQYFLDKTSGVMAGLLSVELDDSLYILDIKSWRVFSIPLDTLQEPFVSLERFRRSIPLKSTTYDTYGCQSKVQLRKYHQTKIHFSIDLMLPTAIIVSFAALSSAVVIDHTGFPRYCAKDMAMSAVQPLNGPLSSSLELRQVQIMVRHGARTPWSSGKCWDGYNEVWTCNLRDQMAPVLHTDEDVPSSVVFDK
ncbi:hypothetical protein THRCLA_00102, partial [Thraustotheca clavata]